MLTTHAVQQKQPYSITSVFAVLRLMLVGQREQLAELAAHYLMPTVTCERTSGETRRGGARHS